MVAFQLFFFKLFYFSYHASYPSYRTYYFLITNMHECKQIVYSQALGFLFLSGIQAFKNLGLKGFTFKNIVDFGPS